MNRLADLERDPHLRQTGFFRSLPDPALGALRMPGPALRFDGALGSMTRPPRLGEHTAEVLREAGFADPEIEALLQSGAAAQWRRTPA